MSASLRKELNCCIAAKRRDTNSGLMHRSKGAVSNVNMLLMDIALLVLAI
jgi:hypothetical protein